MSNIRNNQKIKPLFKSEKTLFIKPFSKQESNHVSHVTLACVLYDEQTEHQLKKTVQRISEGSNIRFKNIIYSNTIYVQIIEKIKMVIMPLKVNPISVYFLMKYYNHCFSQIQIMEAAINGIKAINQLHSLKITHGSINPQNIYYFNQFVETGPNRSANSKNQMTSFGICITDLQSNIFNGNKNDRSQQIFRKMFYSKNKILNFKTSYKDDLQSMIYVLVYMITGNKIFNPQRYAQEWKIDQRFKQWKVTSLFFQILNHLPQKFTVLIQIYLQVQDLTADSKINLQATLKKLNKAKQKEMHNITEEQSRQINTRQQQQSNLDFINEQSYQPQVGEIEQQQIKLIVRPNISGTRHLKFDN